VVENKPGAATTVGTKMVANAKPDGYVLLAIFTPAELFRRNAGIELLYVAYKSEADALLDVLSGQVSAGFFYTAVAVPQIKAGKVRALAVARSERNPAVPDVPSMAEAGYPGCEFRGTVYLLGPAGVPEKVVAALNKEISAIMQESDVRAQYAATGADPVYGTVEEARSLLARETELNVSLVKALNVKPE
jgi:tripartite-type tricarboxylate transporter receptor subunit TctC